GLSVGLTIGCVRPAGVRPLAPVQAKPAQLLQDALLEVGVRTLAIGVFETQYHLAAVTPGEQAVEQRRARIAEVHATGGRRCETGGRCHGAPCYQTRGFREGRQPISCRSPKTGTYEEGVTMKSILALVLFAFAPASVLAGDAPAETGTAAVYVKLATTDGDIYLELDREKAPVTVANFVQYVTDGHYDGTIFHRVIPGFVAQGGGCTADFTEKPTRESIQNESKNGLLNIRGTLAMARTPEPHSAGAQWYINLVDNPRLDGSEFKWGYAVFGKVVRGMED